VAKNPPRAQLIRDAITHKEAVACSSGALATWTPRESTGRSPKDTVIVRRASSEAEIDWDSPNNNPIAEDTFDRILDDAFATLRGKRRLYEIDRVVGADSAYALPIKLVTDRALTSLFADNMFRAVPADVGRSVFGRAAVPSDRPALRQA